MADKSIRIGLGSISSPKSALWTVVVGSSQVYFSQRSGMQISKFSLHDSGKWRYAVNDLNWSKAEDRALKKWDRPNPICKSLVLGPAIVFPPIEVELPLGYSDTYTKETFWLAPPNPEEVRVIMLFFSLGSAHLKEHCKKYNIKPDWLYTFPIKNNSRLNADVVTVVSWLQPYSEDDRKLVAETLSGVKIHYDGDVEPDIRSTALQIVTPSVAEISQGKTITIFEVMLGKDNLSKNT
jgi:hypothetical protein